MNLPLTVRLDDVYLVSYPRSGNTWLRFVISNMLFPEEPSTFINIRERFPDIYHSNEKQLSCASSPRYLKSHQPFDNRYPSVVYLVRDPRAVAVSYYHFYRRVGLVADNVSMNEFIVERFIKGDVQFGAWDTHVSGWLDSHPRPSSVCLLKYEALLDNPITELKKMNNLLRIPRSDEVVQSAFECAKFARMQELENAAGKNWDGARLAKDLEVRHVRQGLVDGWKTELDILSRLAIEDRFAQMMAQLNYL